MCVCDINGLCCVGIDMQEQSHLQCNSFEISIIAFVRLYVLSVYDVTSMLSMSSERFHATKRRYAPDLSVALRIGPASVALK